MKIRILSGLVVLVSAGAAHGSFTVVKGIDNWNAAVPSSTTIDFVLSTPQFVSDQYAPLGAIFPEAEEWAYGFSGFQQDGWGCKGALGGDADIRLQFLEPQYAIGAWFPGQLFAKLYWQGALIYSSQSLDTFPLSYSFGGIVSTQPFDEVVLWDSDGFIFVDDIKFSSTVPSPGAVAPLLGALPIGGRGRRRRS